MDFKENWRLYQNYIIIGVLSLISVFFLPMLGTEVGIGFKVPNTTAGWVVWTLTKLCIVAINIMLLDQFIKQAKVNVRNNENFKEANEYYYAKTEEDEYLPSPKEYISSLYKKKGITNTITSALSVFGLTSAILSFDWVSMLTYLFTIVFGLVFGWITMNNVEDYWTDTYYRRYKRDKAQEQAKKDLELAEAERAKQENDSACIDCRDDILDSSMGACDISNNYKPLVVDSNFCDYRFLGRAVYPSDSSSASPNSVCGQSLRQN